MTAFLIGFAVGGFFGAVAVILWALCAAQKDTGEKGDALPPAGGGARMPKQRPTRPPKR